MANGDVQANLSDQYLQQFNLPIGVSGMQKLQQFPALQKLGYAGQLGSMKKDFHGLQDFKSQMSKYSSVSHTLKIAWSLISAIVPNNPSIALLLKDIPGLGTVGQDFLSISGFGKVFSLTPQDLSSPSAVAAKAAVAKNASTTTSNTTDAGASASIGGGSGLSFAGNASMLNGFQIVGTPSLTNNTILFDGTNLVWSPGGGGGGPISGSIFAIDDGLDGGPGSFNFDVGI